MASKRKRKADPDEYRPNMPTAPLPVVDTSDPPFHPPPEPK